MNVGSEPQKSGVEPSSVDAALEEISELGVVPQGLMAIPPAPGVPEESRPYFKALADLFRRLQAEGHQMQHLSMGMTDDFEVAIEEGATLVRVGRAIFGPRTE